VLPTATATIDELISDSLKEIDEANLRRKYSEQDEFVIVDDFLPLEMISRWEVEVETLKPHVHRNYLLGHKKGGSAAYKSLTRLRFVSNMKDAVAYFGLRGVFGKRKVR